MNNVTEKTHGLVQRWIHAKNRVNGLKREINSAECEQANAMNELGKWLIPEGQPEGEMFNIWFGSGIIQAKKVEGRNDYEISWRKIPDGKDALEFGV